MLTGNVRIIGADIVKAKLTAAVPRILETNRLLVTAILDGARPTVVTETPWGPGHFGYHGKDTIRVVVESKGKKTIGKMMGAVQLFWRERGTVRERKFNTAHKAVAAFKKLIAVYYGGGARWWR